MLKNYNKKGTKSAVDYAFNILANVQQEQDEMEEIDGVQVRLFSTPTEWSIVYDIKNIRIYFRTLANQKIRYINVNSFDFSCKTPVKILDIQADLSGDVTKKFINYTQQINRKLIGNAFKKTFNTPENALNAILQYPETTICMDK